MSLSETRCPHCQALFRLPPDQMGVALRCGRCGETFTPPAVPPPLPTDPPAEPPAVARPVARPVAKRVAMPAASQEPQPVFELAAEPPPAGPRRAAFRDRPPRSRRDPADRPPAKSGGTLLVLSIVGGVGLLGLSAFGIAGYFVYTSLEGDAALTRTTGFSSTNVSTNSNGLPVVDVGRSQATSRTSPTTRTKDEPPPFNPDPFPPIVKQPEPPFGNPFPQPPVNPPVRPKVPPKYAAIAPVPITPAPLTADRTEVKLPAPIGDVCAGGGGRFLILHLPQTRQFAVFDASQGKVAKYIPVPAENVRFAAGMNKLVVVAVDAGTISRYDLTTFEREVTIPAPLDGPIKQVCMGAASAGPLVVYTGRGAGAPNNGGLFFLDPATFKEVDLAAPVNGGWWFGRDRIHVRASPDGTVYGAWTTEVSPTGLNAMVVNGGTVTHRNEHTSAGHVVPGPDGTIYTAIGRYTPDLKRLTGEQRLGRFTVPAQHGSLYLEVAAGDAAKMVGGGPQATAGATGTVTVRMAGDDRALVTLPGIETAGGIDQWAAHSFTADKRIFFAPDAQVLAVIPATNDKLVVHKFDLDAALDKAGIDYLFVTSRPPAAVPGKKYDYPIGVKSRKGGVKYKLDAGPDGMKLSADGKLTWDVPVGFADPVSVIVTVSDATGQEVFHTFRLSPGAAGGGGGVALTPPAAPVPPAGQPEPGVVRLPSAVLPIKPTAAADATALRLPSPADASCVGGGGRYVVFRLPKARQLAVVDATLGRVVKYVPLAEDGALFAAGMTKLFVLNPTANVIQRWSLLTFEKEATIANPVAGVPRRLLMGHQTDGPLYVAGQGVTQKHYALLDTKTFQEVEVRFDGGGRGSGPGVSDWYPPVVRVSADGRVYSWWSVGLSPAGINTFVIGTNSAKAYNLHDTGGALLPSPDGTHLFTQNGVYTVELKPVGKVGQWAQGAALVPATSGPWYLAVTGGGRYPGDPNAKDGPGVAVRMLGDDRTLFTLRDLPGLDFPRDVPRPGDGVLALYDRLFFVPEAEVLVAVSASGDRVVFNKFNVKARLDASGIDYLMVMSRPPAAAGRGLKFRYDPAVLSKKGGVKFRVEAGPEGMKADDKGVSWDVPAAFADAEVSVILLVSDATGQEAFHTFKLAVRAKDEVLAAAAAPAVLPEPAAGPPIQEAPPAAVDPTRGGSNLIVPPLVHPVVKATEAADGAVVKFPAAADYSCYAAGGRYVLFRLPSVKQLAVFDVQAGKVVRLLPLAVEGALVAGGATKLFVLNPSAKVVLRYSLDTFEKELTVPYPLDGAPARMAVGHLTDGPVLVAGAGVRPNAKYAWLSGRTLKEVEVKVTGWADWTAPLTLTASANGRTYTDNNGGYLYWCALGPGGGGVQWTSNYFARPLADGRVVMQGSVFTPTPDTTGRPAGNVGATHEYPAAHGPFAVRLPLPMAGGRPKKGADPKEVAVVHVTGSVTVLPLGEIGDAPAPPAGQLADAGPAPVYLVPEAGLLAVLSADRTALTLRKVDLRAALEKPSAGSPVFVSSPPVGATRGRKFEYAPTVWGAKGAALKLTSGPNGMAVENGVLKWTPSPGFAADEVRVTVTASADGKDAAHEFPLTIADDFAPPPAKPAPPKTTPPPDRR